MVVSRQFHYSKTFNNDLQCRRTSQFIANLGVIVAWSVQSLIKGSNETQGCELLRLIHGY